MPGGGSGIPSWFIALVVVVVLVGVGSSIWRSSGWLSSGTCTPAA